MQLVRLIFAILTISLFIPTRVSAEVAPVDPVAVQLYVFGEPASQPAEPLKGVLETVRDSGYSQIQAWLDYYKTEESAKTLQALLDEYGIKLVAAYTGGNMHEADKAEADIENILEKARIAVSHGLQIVFLNPYTTTEPTPGGSSTRRILPLQKRSPRSAARSSAARRSGSKPASRPTTPSFQGEIEVSTV